MPYAQIDGRNIYYELHGEGNECLTFLNGLTMSTQGWNSQVGEFSRHFRVLLLDMCGQGRSDKPAEEIYPLERQCDDVAALLTQLGIARTHVLGISYGGMVAQLFALRHADRLQRLVLSDTLAWSDEANAALGAALEAAQNAGGPPLRFKLMKAITFGSSFLRRAPKVVDMVEASDAALPWSAVVSLMRPVGSFDLRSRHGEISAPTLVLVGAEDRFTPLYQAQTVAAGIPGARLEILPEVGHAPMLENPRLFNALAADFLRAEVPAQTVELAA